MTLMTRALQFLTHEGRCSTAMLLQQYVEHGGRLYKLYVLGNDVSYVTRPSFHIDGPLLAGGSGFVSLPRISCDPLKFLPVTPTTPAAPPQCAPAHTAAPSSESSYLPASSQIPGAGDSGAGCGAASGAGTGSAVAGVTQRGVSLEGGSISGGLWSELSVARHARAPEALHSAQQKANLVAAQDNAGESDAGEGDEFEGIMGRRSRSVADMLALALEGSKPVRCNDADGVATRVWTASTGHGVPFGLRVPESVPVNDALTPPGWFVQALGRHLRQKTGLTMFNVDVIGAEAHAGPDGCTRYCVVDINYFPGFDKLDDFEARFVAFLREQCLVGRQQLEAGGER